MTNLLKLDNKNIEEDSLTLEMKMELEKIEDVDHKNPYLVTEYRSDIYKYLLFLENVDPIKSSFLEGKVK